jgi:hypothetical protein
MESLFRTSKKTRLLPCLPGGSWTGGGEEADVDRDPPMFGVAPCVLAHRSGSQLPATTTTFNHSARSSAFTHLQISCCLAELSHLTAQCQVRSSKPLFWSWDPWTMFGGIGAEASVVGAATTSSCRVHERVFTTWKASCFRDMRKNTATRKVACFAVSSDMLRCSHT